MKKICIALAALACLTASPALAAKVYLKDGGIITAQKVWRANGKVVVLINRDSVEEFLPAEVNLKRTFPHKQRKPVAAVAATPSPAAATEPAKGDTAKKSVTPPAQPDKAPAAPASGDGGTIRKHKKEMLEKTAE